MVSFWEDPVGWVIEIILGAANKLWDALKGSVELLVNSLVGWIGGFWDSLTSFTTWITGEIWGLLNAAWKSLSDFTGWLAGSIWGLLNAAWNSISDFTSFLITEIDKVLKGVVKEIEKWVKDFVTLFAEGAANGFFLGLDKGIKEAHGSPLNVEIDSNNPILKGLQHYMKRYRENRSKKEVK